MTPTMVAFFAQGDQDASQRRDHVPSGLRQHDEPQVWHERESDRAGGFGLTGGHGVDAGPERLADECRGVGREAHHASQKLLSVEVLGQPQAEVAEDRPK